MTKDSQSYREIIGTLAKIPRATLKVAVAPAVFFRENQNHPVSRTLIDTCVLLVVLMAPVVATLLLNYDEVKTVTLRGLSNVPPGRSVVTDFVRSITPWQTLLYPVMWLLYILLFGALRYLMLLVLGEKNPKIYQAMAVTSYAVRPFMIIAALLHVTNNIWPIYVASVSPGLFGTPRILIANVLMFAVWAWDAVICIGGFRSLYDQNYGRAVIVWLSPFVFLFILFWAALVFYLAIS